MSRRVRVERRLAARRLVGDLVDHHAARRGPARAQTSTHSRAALAVAGVDEDARTAPAPCRAAPGTSPYFWVAAKCARSSAAPTAGCGWLAANASIAGSSDGFRLRRRRGSRVSGQALTQAMQPTQPRRSERPGSAARARLKSRVADVPGGMMLRARPASAGSSASAMPAPVAGHDRRGRSPRRRHARRTRAGPSPRGRASWISLASPGPWSARSRRWVDPTARLPLERDGVDEVGQSRSCRSAAPDRGRRRRRADGSCIALHPPAASSSGTDFADRDRRGAS